MRPTNRNLMLDHASILVLSALIVLVAPMSSPAEFRTRAVHTEDPAPEKFTAGKNFSGCVDDIDLIRTSLVPGLLWSFLNGNAILAAHLAEILYFDTPTAPKVFDASIESSLNPGEVSMTGNELTDSERQLLDDFGWRDRVSLDTVIWVDVNRQLLTVIKTGEIERRVACATATAGTGSLENSNQTPLGWHHVEQKFGDDAPWGQVFRARVATDEIWTPGDDISEDLVLTRLLWLSGDEPGINRGLNASGLNVDSKSRFIYIHGTNDEAKIGTPSSHGCIRLMNDDVITLFATTALNTPVLITAQPVSVPPPDAS